MGKKRIGTYRIESEKRVMKKEAGIVLIKKGSEGFVLKKVLLNFN